MCLAVPGKITSITGDDQFSRIGKIDFGGVLKEASLAYVPEAKIGDYVIVHVGFALSRVDEAEALKVFEYLREIQELGELEEAAEYERSQEQSFIAAKPEPPSLRK
jgi:hydrogenase expression/formation protein HypC